MSSYAKSSDNLWTFYLETVLLPHAEYFLYDTRKPNLFFMLTYLARHLPYDLIYEFTAAQVQMFELKRKRSFVSISHFLVDINLRVMSKRHSIEIVKRSDA